MRLFDIETHTKWPDTLIQALSFAPGQARDFLVPPDSAAWPTRIWPIFRRPFLRVEGKSYCFDHIAFFDRFYRHLVRLLRQTDVSTENEIKKIQSTTVERLAKSLFESLLPAAQSYANVFYEDGKGEWCEADLILLYKDVLLVVEVRSGAVTPTSPDEDLEAYFRSIQQLMVKPSSQANRLIAQVKTGPVALFDSNNRSKRA
jgi:hypothetical protein